MPAAAKTSDEAIIGAAVELLEQHGSDAVTMQAVAQAVGVRAPSLYKRFADRSALLGAVERHALAELGRALARVPVDCETRRELVELAAVYRAFALEHPRLYAHAYRPSSLTDADAAASRAAAARPLLDRLATLLPPEKVLIAARVVTAFLHGFVSMQIAGAFRLGGDVDEAFTRGLDAVIDASLSL